MHDRSKQDVIHAVFPRRDIAKNSLLRWPSFIYWTVLGVYDAIVMFFGAYFLFDNTTFTSNGQVTSGFEQEMLLSKLSLHYLR